MRSMALWTLAKTHLRWGTESVISVTSLQKNHLEVRSVFLATHSKMYKILWSAKYFEQFTVWYYPPEKL